MKRVIEAICTGTARPFNGVETSAIIKRPREGVVQILEDGFAPDEQADRRVHGGPEKAVHLYPLDHHDFWRDRIGEHPALDEPGAFGSNLAVSDLTEADVHIGDRFRLGSALLEISQPRQPCWKVDHRFATKGMTATIVKTARSGWYFRVCETGDVQAGDMLERVEIGHADWSVERVFKAVMLGQATLDEFAEIASLERLYQGWRAKAASKLGSA